MSESDKQRSQAYSKFLILREYFILRPCCFVLNCENINSRMTNLTHYFLQFSTIRNKWRDFKNHEGTFSRFYADIYCSDQESTVIQITQFISHFPSNVVFRISSRFPNDPVYNHLKSRADSFQPRFSPDVTGYHSVCYMQSPNYTDILMMLIIINRRPYSLDTLS